MCVTHSVFNSVENKWFFRAQTFNCFERTGRNQRANGVFAQKTERARRRERERARKQDSKKGIERVEESEMERETAKSKEQERWKKQKIKNNFK